MTHRQLVETILARAACYPVAAHGCGDSRACTGTRGFPDLVIAGQHGLMFIEAKTDGDDTTAWQDLWRWTLMSVDGLCDGACARSGILYLLVTPADLAAGGPVDQHLAAIA